MKLEIESWGNDLAIKLPKLILEQLSLNISDDIEMDIVDSAIVLSRPITNEKIS